MATWPPEDSIVTLPMSYVTVTYDQDMFTGAGTESTSAVNPTNYHLVRLGGGEVEFVSSGGQCREAALYFGALATAGRRATVLPGPHSLVGDAGFTSLGTFTYAPFEDSDTAEAAATKVVLRRSSGVIATGIDAVRFVVMDAGFNNGNLATDGSVYFEFDVIGAAIPVPPVPVVTITGTNVSAETDNSAAAGYATASAFSADIVADDLINAGQPSLVSASWDKTPLFQTDPVNDGDGHPAGSAAGTYLPATFGGTICRSPTPRRSTPASTPSATISSEIRSFAVSRVHLIPMEWRLSIPA